MARDLGVPDRVIEKPPTAGLWVGQTDEAEMGFSYDTLEAYLVKGASAVDRAIAERIDRLQKISDHKRALPPIAPV